MLLNLFSIVLFGYVSRAIHSTKLEVENLRCHQGFCDSVSCSKITDCPNGLIVPKASFCNCCNACIPTLEEGRRCELNLDGSLKDIKTPRCKNGLQCINGICASDIRRCLGRWNFLKKKRSVELYADNLWIPECDKDGNYVPKQIKNNKKSICVNVEGNRIFGLAEEGLSRNMTCGCSRYKEEQKNRNSFMTKPEEHCSSDGNFDTVQCIDNLCYCADPMTGKVKGRIVEMEYLDKLPCSSNEDSPKVYLRPCEVELVRTRKLVYDFRLKGIDVYLQDTVACDADGTYSPVQCDSTVCVCTNTEGIGIHSYRIAIEDYHMLTTKMTCSCARDIVSHGIFPVLNCKGYGSNMPLHCFRDDACFCVDEVGDLISKELNKTVISESICLEALQNLHGLQGTTATSATQ